MTAVKTAAAKGIERAMKTRRKAVSPGRYFLPYQLDWINDAADLKLGDKSRRTGWTWAEAYDATSSRFRGSNARNWDYWLSSADESAGAEFVGYCEFFGKKFFDRIVDKYIDNLTDPHTKEKYTAFVVRCPNGKRITAMSSNPRRFRSKGGDVALDEFDFHDQPGEMWDAANAVTQWGGSIRVFSTRSAEGTEFDRWAAACKKLLAAFGITDFGRRDAFPAYAQLIAKAKELKITPVFSYHRVTLDDAIAQGLAEKIAEATNVARSREEFRDWCRSKSRNESAFLQEYMCQPSTDYSSWLTYALIRSCEHSACPKAGDELVGYEGGVCDIGVDVGRKHDLTVITVLEHVGDVRWLRLRKEIKGMPTPEQEDVLAGIIRGVRLGRCCIDRSGIGLGLCEHTQRTFGEHCIEGIDLTNKNKEVLANDIRHSFEDRSVRISADDADLTEDQHKARKGVTATGAIRFEGERDDAGHSDRFWSLALALHAGSGQAHVPFEYLPAGKCVAAGGVIW